MEMIYIGEPCHYLTVGKAYSVILSPEGYFRVNSDRDTTCSYSLIDFQKSFIHPSHYKPEPEQKKQEACLYQVGDTVHHWKFGEGAIIKVGNSVRVDFKEGVNAWFSLTGFYEKDGIPTLSFTPYDLVNGGFSQERPKPEPKVGDWGYFWDKGNDYARFSRIELIGFNPDCPYEDENRRFDYFSHEIPPHIKEKMK